MMNDKQILFLIREQIAKAFRAPNVIVTPDVITGMARKAAYEIMQPYIYYVQTTDATPTNITVVEIADDESGKLHIELEAVKADGTTSESIERMIHYKKTAGTLTINTMWDVFGGDLAVALAVADDGSDNIKIEATGIAATTIDWECYVKQRKIVATALP